jgi:hypothetical protein
MIASGRFLMTDRIIIKGNNEANIIQGTDAAELIYGYDPDHSGPTTSITASRVASGLSQALFATSSSFRKLARSASWIRPPAKS